MRTSTLAPLALPFVLLACADTDVPDDELLPTSLTFQSSGATDESTSEDATSTDDDATSSTDSSTDGDGDPPDDSDSGSAGDGDGDPSGDGDGDSEPDCVPSSGVTILDDDIGRDDSTCLTWTRTIVAQGSSWSEIYAACEDLTLGGFDDWRMPTTREALTWPQALVPATYWDAALTSPRYVPMGTTPDAVEGTFHVCAVAWYNGVDATCQWWGPANINGTFCVRGQAQQLPEIPEACQSTCANSQSWDVVVEG